MIAPRLRTVGTRPIVAAALILALAAAAQAQNVFVCLGGRDKLGTITAIAPPGYAWDYSAAAPVPGNKWNRIRKPAGVDITDPSIAKPGTTPARLGSFILDTANSVPLVDSQGAPANVNLTIQVEIKALSTDKARIEPTSYNKSKGGGAVPLGLMDTCWRVYVPENRLHFSLTGLTPGRPYTLYFYGGCADPGNNPNGDGDGARFTLAPENVSPGKPGTAETSGGYCASVYTFDPATERIAASPLGTSWTKLDAVANAQGALSFTTSINSNRRHYLNGFQLVERAAP